MKRFWIILTLTVLSGKLLACDCNDTISVSKAYENASSIFTGKVISVIPIYQNKNQKLYTHVLVKFVIDKVYKGKELNTIEVKTATSTAMCGFPFKEGITFLVYTQLLKDNEKPYYWSDVCDRTKSIEEAEYDFRELGGIKK